MSVCSILVVLIVLVVVISIANLKNTNPVSPAPIKSGLSSGNNSPPITSGQLGSGQPNPKPQPPNCVTASQAASEEGQTGCVQFTGYAYTSYSGQMYLNQYSSAPYGFSVWIPAGTPDGSNWLNEYSGQSIDVTGSIVNYNGEPEIEVTSSSQISLAP